MPLDIQVGLEARSLVCPLQDPVVREQRDRFGQAIHRREIEKAVHVGANRQQLGQGDPCLRIIGIGLVGLAGCRQLGLENRFGFIAPLDSCMMTSLVVSRSSASSGLD